MPRVPVRERPGWLLVELDLTAAGRALDFLGVVATNLVTLHADFLLGFIFAVAGLRRYRRGIWREIGYASFLLGLTAVLFLAISFLGLRLDLPAWLLFLLGLAAGALAWVTSGALPISARRIARRLGSAASCAISSVAFRVQRTEIPDRLPPDLRSLDAGRR